MAVPPQKNGLLTELESCGALYGDKFDDENLLPEIMENIIVKKPAVKKLLINPPVNCPRSLPFCKGLKEQLTAAQTKGRFATTDPRMLSKSQNYFH